MTSKVSAGDYNTIQSQVASVLGVGSGDYGYGQAVASGQVTQAISIKSAQWVNLRNDLLKARQHQTGLDETARIPTTGVGEKIRLSVLNGAIDMGNNIVADRLIRPVDSQTTLANLVSPQVRTSPWNSQLNQVITVTFADSNAVRYFFNSGSEFQFSASITGYSGSGAQKAPTWDAMLSGMGVITFTRSNTSCSGSGNGSAIGFNQLTYSYQQIFQKPAPAGTYADNDYYIYAKLNSATQIEFTISFQDNATFTNTTIYPGNYGPYGVDEMVDGTLTSYVKVRYASGSNVQVAVPAASTTGI